MIPGIFCLSKIFCTRAVCGQWTVPDGRQQASKITDDEFDGQLNSSCFIRIPQPAGYTIQLIPALARVSSNECYPFQLI
jgi:hypothetical protein